ncbi:MAG: nucleotidyltransferase family protein [Pyrinomonadaceae bacterium]|nr:nucleotidyltransferase family protein [Pyrinomonadaceae bacterium]
MDIAALKEKVRAICEESDLAMLGVFGSVARGDDRPDSDVDIIVRFRNPVGLLEMIRLEDRLRETIGRPVDLGTEGSLHPLIRKDVLNDLKILYEG